MSAVIDQRVALAFELRSQCRTWGEVADRLGVHINTVYLWRNAEAREKAAVRSRTRKRDRRMAEPDPTTEEAWADRTWATTDPSVWRWITLGLTDG